MKKLIQKYEKYQDSSIEWLDKIPGHWTITKLSKTLQKIVSIHKRGSETSHVLI